MSMRNSHLGCFALLFAFLYVPVPVAFGAGDSLHHEAELLHGRVVLTGTTEGSQVVAVDSLPVGEPDGTFDHVFILQQHEPAEILVEDWEDARVLARREILLIIPPHGASEILLHLSSVKLHAETPGEASPLENREVVEGYGLARHDGLYDLAGQAPGSLVSWHEVVTRVDRNPEVSDFEDCQSGGIGARMCSQTCAVGNSCTITCDPGFHACCSCHSTGATCQCKRDP